MFKNIIVNINDILYELFYIIFFLYEINKYRNDI